MVKKIIKFIGDLLISIGKFFRKGKNQEQPEESKEPEEPEEKKDKGITFPY